MISDHRKHALLAFLLLALMAIFLARGLLFSSGTVLYGDFISTLTKDKFIGVYYPTWTENGEFYLNGLPRLAYLLVFSTPFYLFDLSADIYFKLLIVSTFIIAGFSMYVLVTTVLKKHVVGKTLFICGITAAVLYAFNPWVMDRIPHRFLLTSYSILPLIFLFSFKALKDSKLNFKYSFAAAILFTLASTSIHSILFISILLLSLLIYLFFSLKQYKRLLLNSLLLLALYFAFSLYWILPSIYYSTSQLLQPEYVSTIETVRLLSRNSNLLAVIGLGGYWNPKIVFSGFLDVESRIISLVIPVLCFSAALFYRKSKKVICLSLLGFATIFLSTGTNVFPYIYEQLCFNNLPLFGTFSWIFRDPDKWGFLSSFVYSLLLGLTFAALMNKLPAKLNAKKWKKLRLSPRAGRLLIQVGVIVSVLLFTVPIADAYLNQVINPVAVPNEFYATNAWLATDSSISKVLWLPKLAGGGTTWAPEGVIGPFDLYSSAKSAVGLSQKQSAYLNKFSLSALSNNKTKFFGKYLDALNIRYVVFRNDSLSDGEASEVFRNLENQLDMKLVHQDGFVYIFENENWSPNAFVPAQNFLVAGGLSVITSANFIGDFKPGNCAFTFLEEDIRNTKSELSDILISGKKTGDLLFHFIGDKQVIVPFDYTNHHNPSALWSKATTDDPLHGEWHSYLEKNGIDNWDLDYGEGLVFTWAKSELGENQNPVALTAPFEVSEDGEYAFLVRLFQNQEGGEIQVQIDNVDYTISTQDQLNGFSWEKLDNLFLQEGQHEITLTNLGGFNAVNLFALVPKQQYEAAQNELMAALQNKSLVYILEGESHFYRLGAVVSSKYGVEASNGEVLELNQTSKVYTEIESLNDSNYTLAIRSKGNFHITLNEETYAVSSETLNWTYIGPIHLERGTYTIEIMSTSTISSDLDVVWLYSTQDSGETLEDVFAGDASASIISLEKVDSTQYVISVNASKPFLLCFAEAYDPLWIASVNGNQVGSVPVFSMINGFWVNNSGVLEIRIEYTPQEWFFYGSVVSTAVIVTCTASFVYVWIKRETFRNWIRVLLNRMRIKLHVNKK